MALSWLAVLVILLAGLAKLLGVTLDPAWLSPASQASLPTPVYTPMAGTAYVKPAGQACTLIRPKSHLGYVLELDYFNFDYTVCDGLPVDILKASWFEQGSSGCYLYYVRVVSTTNMAGWIRQDELAPDPSLSPPACPPGLPLETRPPGE